MEGLIVMMDEKAALARADGLARGMIAGSGGPDPKTLSNELKNVINFLRKKRDKELLSLFLNRLPDSNYAGRSKGIETCIGIISSNMKRLLRLEIDELLLILGWTCRLLAYYSNKTGRERK